MALEEEGVDFEEGDIRYHLIHSSSGEIDYNYQVGVLEAGDPNLLVALVVVAEVDHRILVAVPEQAWHRKRARRTLPPDSLQKVVSVLVPGCLDDSREVPEDQPNFKVWLGLLTREFEEQVEFGGDRAPTIRFPVREDGLDNLPFAQSLVEVAKDHYTFFTAESASGAVPDAGNVGQRLGVLEQSLQAIQESLEKLQPQPSSSRPPALRPTSKAAAKGPPAPAMDAQVARQALAAGVTPDALDEMAGFLGLPPGLPPAASHPRVKIVDPVESEEEEDIETLFGNQGDQGGSGSQDPMQQAVLQLSRIVTKMSQEKKKQSDKNIESILDRAESGSVAGGESSSGRSKAAALRRLRATLFKKPELIYQALEARMAEDWVARQCPWCCSWWLHCPWLGRAQVPHSVVSELYQIHLGSGRGLGRPERKQCGSCTSQNSSGSGSTRPASGGQRRGGSGGTTSILEFCCSSWSRTLGVASQQTAGRKVAGTHFGKTERHRRLSRKAHQVGFRDEEERGSACPRSQAESQASEGGQRGGKGCQQGGPCSSSSLSEKGPGLVEPSRHASAATNLGEVPARKPPWGRCPQLQCIEIVDLFGKMGSERS